MTALFEADRSESRRIDADMQGHTIDACSSGPVSQTRLARWATRVGCRLAQAVEIVAGLLVVAETIILFLGVVSRFVLRAPLTWSDELASILFVWLAVVGAALAYDRAEHMRMGALVDARPWRRGAETLSWAASLVFLGLIVWPAWHYASEQLPILTPALEISDAWRAFALPTGIGLMIVFGVLRCLQSGRLLNVVAACAAIALIAVCLHLSAAQMIAVGNYRLVVYFVLLVGAAVFSGVPIAFAFGLGTFAYLALTTHVPVEVVVGRIDEGMSHLILLAVPLFILLGLMIRIAGMGRTMVGFLASLIGHLRGGLQYVLVAAMYLMSGISGAKAADMAAVAPVLFPELRERGVPEGELVALLSATGAQTETVPPSLVLITIGSVTGVSISALFIGGLLPSLLLAFVLCAVVRWRIRGLPVRAPQRASASTIALAFLLALPALLLPFLIRTAVVYGVATATEVSTVGIVYVLLYMAVACALPGGRIRWQDLWTALIDTSRLSGAVLFIIGTATAMAWALTQSGFSHALARTMAGLPGGWPVFMGASIVAFTLLGSVLEGIPAVVLFGPLLFPIAKSVGINEVHYAIVAVLAMGIGLFAPPFGIGYYAACAVSRIEPTKGLRPILPYLAALFIGTLFIASVPWITTGFIAR